MNKKHLFYNIAYVIGGITVAVGLSYVVHAAGTLPTPPDGNTPAPLNVGILDQIKTGGLAVDAFVANANAEMDGNTYFDGVLHSADANGTINFGDSTKNSAVSLAINGWFTDNNGTMKSAPLANNTMNPICADETGTIVLCTGSAATITTTPTKQGAIKNFLAILTSNKSAQFFSNTVVNGKTVTNFAGAVGLDNDHPTGWQVNTIPGIQATSFSPQGETLLLVREAGSYAFNIASSGKLGIKGKFGGDYNSLAASFWMRITHADGRSDDWIDLTSNPANNGFAFHEDPKNNTTPDFKADNLSTPNGAAWNYMPYNFTFNKTIQLAVGDTVGTYAYIFGSSITGCDLFIACPIHNSPNNFYYSIESDTGNTTFNIIETAQ